jgi:hypothetical protein
MELRAHCGFRYCFDTQRHDDVGYLLCAKYNNSWPEYAVKMVPREEGQAAPPDAWDPTARLVMETDDDADVPQPGPVRWDSLEKMKVYRSDPFVSAYLDDKKHVDLME